MLKQSMNQLSEVFLKIGIVLRVSPDLTGYYLYKDMSRGLRRDGELGFVCCLI